MKKIICIIALLLPVLTGAQTTKTDTPQEKKSKETMVDIITEQGTIRVKLYDETPLHRDNFLKLAKEGFYDGTLFHRIIKNFMIQGGDPNSKTAQPGQMLGNGDVGYTIPAEFNEKLIHKKGALCAARTSNPQKASSGCQFYIVQGNLIDEAQLSQLGARRKTPYTPEQILTYKTIGGTPFLDTEYTVYGEVVSGLDVLDKIASVQTQPGDRPAQDVKMTMKLVE